MTPQELETLLTKAIGYFPRWRRTDELTQVVDALIGAYEYEVALRHLHTHAIENIGKWEPDWRAITAAVKGEYRKRAGRTGWGPGAETQLAYLRQEHFERYGVVPDDEWIILERMCRDVLPTSEERKRGREDVLACYAGTSCDGSLAGIQRLQNEQIAGYLRFRAREAAGAGAAAARSATRKAAPQC